MTATVYALVKVRSPGVAILGLGTYLVAGGAGGALTGIALADIGAALSGLRASIVVVIILVVAAVGYADTLGRRPLRLYILSGVPREWLAWPVLAHLAAYGFVLGAGLLTPSAALIYILAGGVALIGDPQLGALVFATYGGLRATTTVLAGLLLAAHGPIGSFPSFPLLAVRLRQILGVAALGGALGMALMR